MLARPPPIRAQLPPPPPNSSTCARHASIGGAPSALIAHANASRTLTLSRSRRSAVRSSYVVRPAKRAIPSDWLGPEMIGVGLSAVSPDTGLLLVGGLGPVTGHQRGARDRVSDR